jgi:hypothetical protein
VEFRELPTAVDSSCVSDFAKLEAVALRPSAKSLGPRVRGLHGVKMLEICDSIG